MGDIALVILVTGRNILQILGAKNVFIVFFKLINTK